MVFPVFQVPGFEQVTDKPQEPLVMDLSGRRAAGSAGRPGRLGVPERSVRDKWRAWGLQAYRIGKHLRWRERDVLAWIDRQAA